MSPSRKELESRLEAKKFRISSTLEWVESGSMSQPIKNSHIKNIMGWIADCDEIVDHLLMKCESRDERALVCEESNRFSDTIREGVFRIEGGASGGIVGVQEPVRKIPLMRLDLQCSAFDGSSSSDKFEFRTFLKRFEFCTATIDDKADKLLYLKSKLQGRAFELVADFDITADNYSRALNLLRETFMSPDIVRNKIFEEILPQPDPITSIEKLRTYIQQVKSDLTELDRSFNSDFFADGSTSGRLISHILFRKFPLEIRKELMSRSRERYPSLRAIMENVPEIIEFTTAAPLRPNKEREFYLPKQVPPLSDRRGGMADRSHGPLPNKKEVYPLKNKINNNKGRNCGLCFKSDHGARDCPRYSSYDLKIERARELSLCGKCLGAHREENCRGLRGFPFPCVTCGSTTHFSAMCPKSPQAFVGKTSLLLGHDECICPVLNVSIKRDGPPIVLRCLLDTGSQSSFFAADVLNKLGGREEISTRSVVMPINTFIGTKDVKLLQLGVSVKLENQIPFVFPALFADGLSLRFKVSRFVEIVSNIKEAGFRLNPGYERLNHSTLDGLIGLDIIQHLENFRLVSCLNGSAWQTPSGIIPFGDISCFLGEGSSSYSSDLEPPSFAETVRVLPHCSSYLIEGVLNPINSFPDPWAPFFEDSAVERGVENFFSLDSIGVDINSDLSSYDEDKINEFKENIVLKNGKYYVDLPWDEEKISHVDSNYVPALKIMQRVADSLGRKGIYKEYLRVFREYEELGIIEPVHVSSGEFGNYCWVPHRPVIKEGTGVTTKIRPVFNCSFKRRGGVSLNDAAYSGVNLTAKLLDLLLTFRKDDHVLLGDLKKAFLQVRLRTDKDKNRFCFFLKVGDHLRTFRYNSIIFGFNASPFILSFILKYHAERYSYDETSSVLCNNFYVDNIVKTSSSLESLNSTYHSVRKRLKEAGFDLQSCNSNNQSLREEMIEDGTAAFPPPLSEKVLGYRFLPQKDSMSLAPTVIDPEASTKRSILAQCSRVYDPLSLCVPVTIQGKILISELWRNRLSWDQKIPENISENWRTLANDLNSLSELEFPRRALRERVPTEFLCFCDASKAAYGFALYAKQGKECLLIFAKAKVAPLKRKSLPTLELMALYLAVRVIPNVLKALGQVVIQSLYLVSDAQVVLSWVLNGKAAKGNIFVGNRIKDIKRMVEEINGELGTSVQFKYVPTTENPADLLTRGVSSSKFKHHYDLWVYGPDWTRQANIDWPIAPLPCLNDTNKRIVSCMFVEESSPEENALPIEVSNFSSLTRVVNVLQKVLLFIDKLKHRQTDSSGRAKRLLLAAMQREEFPEEILYLKSPSGRNIPPRVSGLGLFVDDEGLIRASGRIQSSNVHPYQVKHPILLGKHHHLTELVIKEAHLNCCHLGTNSTLSKLRLMGFWVPQGRQSVKGVVRHCLVCKKINSLPFEAPVGSQLPVHRANFLHPFQQVGVDFTGHFWLKLNGEDVKMYILLFTCMSLRAVHLELLPDMSTRSFLLAFFRFTNLFGVPTHVYSDNAKTFVASGIVLSEVFVSDEFKNHFRSTSITHVTIPLYSAWHGGAWERMIQTVKQCLKKLVGREKLEYFDFLTILADVERAVNDRPLTYIDSSDMGLDILTPNHFLQTGYNPRLLLGNHEVDDLCPDPPSRIELLESLQLRENYVEKFRRLWHHDYLLSLREHHKDLLGHCPEKISVGEIVLVKTPNRTRPFWSLGKVLRLIRGKDGRVRSACILRDKCEQIHSLNHLYPLEIREASSEPQAVPDLEEEEGGPFFCPTCSVRNDGSSPMVCCDGCSRWYHFDCVGVSDEVTEEEWNCPECTEQTTSSVDQLPEHN